MSKDSTHTAGKAILVSAYSVVSVLTHVGPNITVAVDGDQEGIDGVTVTETDGEVSIVESEPTGSTGDIHVSGNSVVVTGITGGSVSISGGRVIINGRDVTASASAKAGPPREPTRITVMVPAGSGSALRLHAHGCCKATVGDLVAPVSITASGTAEVTCGAAGKTRVRASGTARVAIASVVGDADVKASGCASIDVNGGIIGALEAEASGTASIDVDASADKADLTASGCASIVVDRVKNGHTEDRSGVAKIRVRHTGARR